MTDPLEKVRAAALELPETSEKLSHGQPTFFVADKQFAQVRENQAGSAPPSCGRSRDRSPGPAQRTSSPGEFSLRPLHHWCAFPRARAASPSARSGA